mmetsp:Transcript_2964/g.6734  ORF Transcript_2964/g.6734 Transcript_2964/m.6734 type:complete len:238 (-) Transcript_2964:65-778(-)
MVFDGDNEVVKKEAQERKAALEFSPVVRGPEGYEVEAEPQPRSEIEQRELQALLAGEEAELEATNIISPVPVAVAQSQGTEAQADMREAAQSVVEAVSRASTPAAAEALEYSDRPGMEQMALAGQSAINAVMYSSKVHYAEGLMHQHEGSADRLKWAMSTATSAVSDLTSFINRSEHQNSAAYLLASLECSEEPSGRGVMFEDERATPVGLLASLEMLPEPYDSMRVGKSSVPFGAL